MFFYQPEDGVDFGCPLCKKRYCLKCKVDYHVGSTCEKYQEWARENGLADELFGDFVQGHNFKQCPGCKAWVEKNQGCGMFLDFLLATMLIYFTSESLRNQIKILWLVFIFLFLDHMTCRCGREFCYRYCCILTPYPP